MTNPDSSEPRTFHGGCHCGGLRVEADLSIEHPPHPHAAPIRCNCTFCRKRGAVTMMITPRDFRVVHDETETRYAPHPEIGYYAFCGRCGVHVYGAGHLAEVGGDFVSINIDVLEDVPREKVTVAVLDGRGETWSIVGSGPLLG
ncbi:MAG: GFA family protein [Myxococcales bacterium]|nr:GFA family protein [Myxococcales bacterium]